MGQDKPGHDVIPDQLPCSRSLTVEDSTFVHPTAGCRPVRQHNAGDVARQAADLTV
jgi:hypothetical protein